MSATPKAPAHPAPEPPVYAFSAMMGRAAVYVYAVLLTGCGVAAAQQPPEPPVRYRNPCPSGIGHITQIVVTVRNAPPYAGPDSLTRVTWECVPIQINSDGRRG
jgi:hypothetical protein